MKRKNKVNLWGTHTPTVLSITLVLFVLGLLILLEYHSYKFTQDAQERITYKVDLQPDTDTAAVNVLMAEIGKMPYVKHTEFISKEEAATIFSADLGEDFIDFLGYNPLYPSIMVNFRADMIPSNQSQVLNQFCKRMKNFECVTDVSYQEVVVGEVYTILNKMTWFLIIFVALLLIVCILMIRSTIRIALYAQRDTITTMRLVGATTRFISRPFVCRSLLYGALGGIFACVLIAITVFSFDKQLSLPLIGSNHMLNYAVIAGVIVLIGILITWCSTALAVRHYLKHEIH